MDAEADPKRLQGYVSHGVFGGMAMPATVQNLAMRDYVAKIGGVWRLSVDEFLLPNCHIQFYAMLRNIDQVDGIVMCSLYMLPDDPADRRWVFDRVLEAGKSLHFLFESLVVDDPEAVLRAEELLRMRKALQHCPTRIDPDLLPKLDVVDSFS